MFKVPDSALPKPPRTYKVPPEKRAAIRAELIAERAKGTPVKILLERYNISLSYYHLLMTDKVLVRRPLA